jgi:hypothetical protein
MRVEYRELEIAGEQEDHGANLGDPTLTTRLTRIPRYGNNYGGSIGYQTGCQQVRCPTVSHSIYKQKHLDIADVYVMATVHLADSQK